MKVGNRWNYNGKPDGNLNCARRTNLNGGAPYGMEGKKRPNRDTPYQIWDEDEGFANLPDFIN